ncbi:MAG: dihydrodipicolinate synthase family protein, partial [Bilophila sp.]
MSHTLSAFRGVVCPAFTPLRDGRIDMTAMEKHFSRLTDSGINGILLSGTLAEFPSFSLDERLELIRCARSMTSLPVIVNVATTCMGDMWRLADAACNQGYEALMTLPPYYFGQTAVQLE